MDTAISPSLSKPALFQDLWSEISTATLYASDITWASVIFCTLFNRPLDYLRVGLWLTFFGFFTYFGARLLAAFTKQNWMISVFSGVWLLISLFLFLKFIVYAGTPVNLWHMFLDPFLNLSKQPVLQSVLWQMIFLVLLIRRGFTLAASNANSWRAVRSFQMGMLMFFFFGFTTTWANYLPSLVPFLLYLLFIITSLTTSRLAGLTGQVNYRLPVFTKTWFGWIFALTLTLILVGSSIGWLTGVGMLVFTDWVLRVVFGIGITILVIIFSPLITLIGLLLPWLDNWLSSLNFENLNLLPLEILQKLNQPDPEKAARITATVNQVVTILLIVVLVITAIIVIVTIRRRALRRDALGKDDQVDRALERKLARAAGFNAGFLRSRLDQARRWMAAARIRRVYRQLMDYCKKLDNPRLPAFTPHEFLPQLISMFPEYNSEVTLLTNVYQRVRYGEVPESLEELEEIMAAWSSIKVNAEERVKERRKRLKKN